MGGSLEGYKSEFMHLAGECEEEKDYRSSGIEDGMVYLDHSCDEWIIGGEEEIETMIRDLTAMLDRVRRRK